jgi:thiol-disulfide isomerase/thioredoxin
MNLDRARVRAPEFPEATWINTLAPPTLAALRGRVVLLYLWNYTDSACLRPLPYLRTWHERYSEIGVEFIGVHVPEFRFARDRSLVQSAAGRLGLRWPVILDSESQLAAALAQPVRPALLLIDPQGFVRQAWSGRFPLLEVERELQSILREHSIGASLPDLLPPIRPEDAGDATSAFVTPDLGPGDLGNPFPPSPVPTILEAPAPHDDGRFYLEGLWRWAGEGFSLAGDRGRVHLRYCGATVSAVLSATPHPLAVPLKLANPVEVQLTQDDETLPKDRFAEDTYLAGDQACVRVDVPRLYRLANNPDGRHHELRLEARGPGLTLYAFSFDPALSSEAGLHVPMTE